MELKELKPCPFCGGEAELVDIQAFAWCDTYYFVCCTNPDCEERTPRCECKSDAILAWNRRAENGT
jgi:Lar family restriction alleviation protein